MKDSLPEGALVAMIETHFQYDDDLGKAVLEIIRNYQPIPTMDIWYELGEDASFEGGVALSEMNQILCYLENERKILKKDGNEWIMSRVVLGERTPSRNDATESLR